MGHLEGAPMSRVRKLAKSGLAGALVGTGALSAVRRLRVATGAPRVHVIGYHRVVEQLDSDGPVLPALCITLDAFRRQMQQVKERFTVLSLADAMRAIAGKLPPSAFGGRDACAITFDDGYRDVLLRAHPVLEQLNIPATVFVPTGYAGSDRLLPHDRLHAALWWHRHHGQPIGAQRGNEVLHEIGPAAMVEALIATLPHDLLLRVTDAIVARLPFPLALDAGAKVLHPDELRALALGGWEIGGHTIGHVMLAREPIARVREEIGRSKADLERWTGRPCRYFAYCNGYHSRRLITALKRAGYEGAVTTCDRPNRAGRGDPMRVSRKVLWDAHTRGLDGRWSASLSAAHLHDLFGDLRLTRPVEGDVSDEGVA
jgi:peptidoglycan/xylan/chitin deacetylase (PgdA/CDA1 family)